MNEVNQEDIQKSDYRSKICKLIVLWKAKENHHILPTCKGLEILIGKVRAREQKCDFKLTFLNMCAPKEMQSC